MLKNSKLLGLLTSPDEPDGEPLGLNGNFLAHTLWPIPILDGIPDFVTHAPPTVRTITVQIPIDDVPSPDIFSHPTPPEEIPAWFKDDPNKVRLLQEHGKGIALDAGCGQGNRGSYEGLGYDYIGLDISLNSRQRHDGPADIDVVADCHRIPLPSNSIEVINFDAVLEHLYCPMLAIREFHRLLKSGGLLLGSSAFLEAEHFHSQCHHSWLGLYRLLHAGGFDVQHIYAGLSLWEMHAPSIFLGLPGHNLLGKLHRALYLTLVSLKSDESPQQRLLRHAAILHFVAVKA
jgi:SAM-dependent methyltransferase